MEHPLCPRCLVAIIIAGALILLSPTAQGQAGDQVAEREVLPINQQFEARLNALPPNPEFSQLRDIRNAIVQEIPLAQAELDAMRNDLATLRQRQATMSAELETLGQREQEQIEFVASDITFFEEEIQVLEGQMSEMSEDPSAEYDDIQRVDQRKSELEEQLRGAQAEHQRLQRALQRGKERREQLAPEVAALDSEIERSVAAIADKNRQVVSLRDIQSRIDDRINTLLIPETAQNEFKLWVTAAFSFLVGIVILGFFVIAFRDSVVRQSIFSSQSGIQFLTLFSLVIAIILFGITGILEGKELSALLGGLSGYILGRVGSSVEAAAITRSASNQ